MKKLYKLILALLLSGLTQTYAQLGNGWDSAFNFGGAGNNVNEMRYDNSGNLYFIATAMGKNLFAGTQIDPGGFGSYPNNEIIYGKIAPDGTQTLLKRMKNASGEGRLDADGNLLMILRSGFPTAPVDFGNGIINDTNGAKLLKISNTGVAQWMKNIDTGSDILSGATGKAIINVQGMQFTPDGNLYAVIAANNPSPNPPTPQFTHPTRIIKYNSNGDKVWHTDVFSAGTGGTLSVPKIFVDDAGRLTFGIYSPTNQFYYNGEAIASQMGIYTTGPTTAYSIIFSLNADGSKKSSIADLGTNATTVFSGLNPVNGNLYIAYGAFAAKVSTQVPFSTLPNQNLFQPDFLYRFGGTLIYNSAGQYVKYILGNDVPVLSTIVRNGNKFVTSLNLTPNVVFEKGNYIFNSTLDYSVLEFLDQDFNFVKALKAPKTSLTAIYQNKLSISGEFKTALTFGTKTLTPNFNDTDFGTRFPFFATIKSDMFIAVADAAVITPPIAATWLGVDNNWNNTANWSNGKVPDASTIVKFNANTAQQPTLATTPTALQIIIDAGINVELPQALTIANKIVNNGKLTVSNAATNYQFNSYGAKEITGNGEIFFNGTTVTSSVVVNYLLTVPTKNISFNQPIQISGTFSSIKFIGTRATVTGDITVDNADVNAITGFNSGAYFKGKLTRAVNTSGIYNFPVGAPNGYAVEYAPAKLQLNNLVATKTITVSTEGLYNYTINEINLGSNKITAILQNTYLKITPDVQPTSGSYTIDVEKNTYNNGVTEANRYVLINQNDKVWSFDGTSGTSTQTGGTVSGTIVTDGKANASLSGLTKFANIAIGIANAAITPGLAVTTSTWTGMANTTWANASNWSNGIPSGTVNAIIPAGLSNYPLLFALGDNAKSVTVNTGANIKLDLGVTLTNGLINNGTIEITDLRLNNYLKEFTVYAGGVSGIGKLVFKTLSRVSGGVINNDVEINVGKDFSNNLDNDINIIGKIGGNINILSGAVRAWDYAGQFLESTNPDATITVANSDFHIAGRVLKSVKANGTYFLPLGDEQYHRLGIRKYGAITIKNSNLDAPSVFSVRTETPEFSHKTQKP